MFSTQVFYLVNLQSIKNGHIVKVNTKKVSNYSIGRCLYGYGIIISIITIEYGKYIPTLLSHH